MDHFAKPDDELAIAQRENKLYRNFQGYSTHSECDLIGLGVTSIGSVGDSYSQNRRTLEEYNASLSHNELPVFRGFTLNEDDKVRRVVITKLICHFSLNITAIEKQLDINFAEYFSEVLQQLREIRLF
jgi:oxygen-independent coproporphyrinogen-3 oxidase